MAYRCFKLALSANNNHAEAYNNLGVLEWRRGRGEQVSGNHMTNLLQRSTYPYLPVFLIYMFIVCIEKGE